MEEGQGIAMPDRNAEFRPMNRSDIERNPQDSFFMRSTTRKVPRVL